MAKMAAAENATADRLRMEKARRLAGFGGPVKPKEAPKPAEPKKPQEPKPETKSLTVKFKMPSEPNAQFAPLQALIKPKKKRKPTKGACNIRIKLMKTSDGGWTIISKLPEKKKKGEKAKKPEKVDPLSLRGVVPKYDETQPLKVEHILQRKVLSLERWERDLRDSNTAQITKGSIFVQEDPLMLEEERFLVKWVGLSYIHLSWESKEDLSLETEGADRKIDHFLEKLKDGYDDRCTWSQHVGIERILDIETVKSRDKEKKQQLVLIKWQGLPYNECSWEDINDVNDDNAVRMYKAHNSESAAQQKRRKITKHNRTVFARNFTPIDKSPHYKCGGELRDYQVDSLNWLLFNWLNKRNSLLADEMGLGKTLTVIAFLHTALSRARNERGADYLQFRNGREPDAVDRKAAGGLRPSTALVLVPKAVVSQWVAEWNRWVGRHDASVPLFQMPTTSGTSAQLQMLRIWRERGGALIMSHDAFWRLLAPARPLPAAGAPRARFSRSQFSGTCHARAPWRASGPRLAVPTGHAHGHRARTAAWLPSARARAPARALRAMPRAPNLAHLLLFLASATRARPAAPTRRC